MGERWPKSRLMAAARAWLALVSGLVPASRREDWRDEWEAELWQLWTRAGEPSGTDGRRWEIPSYLAGAPASALWTLKEEWMSDLWQDIRYGARTLFRAPGFLAVTVLTLALGIGANTTVFTLINGLLLREPPVIAAPDELVRIGRGHPPNFDNWSIPVYRDFRERADWFNGVAGFAGVGSIIIGQGQAAAAVPAQLVTDNYFDVLGVRPALGREFVPEETAAPGAGPVVVISHDLWRRRFGSDPDVLGQRVPINGRPYEIVGVAPEEFRGSDVFRAPADLWIPVTMVGAVLGPGLDRLLTRRASSWFWVFARRAADVTFEQAAAATESLYARFDEEHPNLAGQGVWLVQGVGMTPQDRAQAGTTSKLLMGIVILVLLIACANLAGLALARGAARRAEVGIRTALGASRGRVVRQFLTESTLTALAGGAAAIGLTYLVASKLHAFVPYDVSVTFEPDLRVLGFGLAAAVTAGLIFGLAPALSSARTDARTALAGGSRTVTGRGTRLRRGLVAGQLALSFVLLAGTGLLLRSLHNARTVDPGFDPDHAAVVDLDVGMRSGYDEESGRAFYRRLLDRAAELPGAEAVGLAAELPIVDFQSNHTPTPLGEDPSPDGPPREPVLASHAEAGYFQAIGLELLAGRTFDQGDYAAGAEPVAVINRTLARRFFGEANPVGELLPFQAEPDGDIPTRVVGVVGEHRNRGLRTRPWSQYWYPWQRSYRGDMTLVARTRGDPGDLLPRLSSLVEGLDAGMPILRAAPLRELVGRTLRETRMVSSLIAIFGAIALGVAAIGLYGVMAYSVARRTREMGVRIALGARPRDLLGLILRQGLTVALIGLGIGVPLALGALRLLRGMLYDVSPADPLALVGGAALLVTVAAAAALVPARRATRIEPVRALTEE